MKKDFLFIKWNEIKVKVNSSATLRILTEVIFQFIAMLFWVAHTKKKENELEGDVNAIILFLQVLFT